MKTLLPAFVGAAFCFGAAGGAAAQEDPRDALIRDLSARLAAVEAKLEARAKTELDADDKKVPAEAPQVALAAGRPTISAANGDKFAIRGVVQFDAADYAQDASATDLSSGTNFRRARLGVEGTVNRHWNYNVTTEFGGSGTESPVLNAAWVEYAGLHLFGTKAPLRLRVGAWATPAGLEDASPNSDTLFLERPAAAELTRAIAGGDGRSGVGAFANGDRWYGSAVLTGSVAGTAAEFDEQTGYMLRGAVLAAKGGSYAVHLGLNVSGVIEPADTAAGPATTKVLRLRERPEMRVDGTRLVDTGDIPAAGMMQTGVELGVQYKSLFLAAEGFRFEVDRSAAGVGNASFGGWYVQGAWTITGEKRSWAASSGGFKGISPKKAFDPHAGSSGAVEVAARYSVLDLNHAEGSDGQAKTAAGVRGGEQTVTAVGLNWYPSKTVRATLQHQWVGIDRLNNAGAQIGEDFRILSSRVQLAF